MSAIYLDVSQVRSHIAALRYTHPEMDDDARLLEDSLEGSTDLHEVLTKLVRMERETEAFSAAIKAQEDALAARRQSVTRRKEAYRAMIMSLLETAGQSKVRLPEATLSISRSRPGCIITDEALLPEEFVKIERHPKKAEITAAIIAGERIPGAELKNSAPHLTIRT